MNRDIIVVWGVRILSFVIMAILGLVFYWLVIDRSPPATIFGGEVLRYERQSDGGWLMIIKWRGERHRNCWGNSKRWIADNNPLSVGLVLPLEDIAYPPDYNGKPTGTYEWEVPIHIPPYFASTGHTKGAYKIRILYSCNPLQQYMFPIVVEPPPVPFQLPNGDRT